jgi:hypothetical protein
LRGNIGEIAHVNKSKYDESISTSLTQVCLKIDKSIYERRKRFKYFHIKICLITRIHSIVLIKGRRLKGYIDSFLSFFFLAYVAMTTDFDDEVGEKEKKPSV